MYRESSAWTIDSGVRDGDPIAFAGARLAKLLVTELLAEECKRCGVVADLETDDGLWLCEGCS